MFCRWALKKSRSCAKRVLRLGAALICSPACSSTPVAARLTYRSAGKSLSATAAKKPAAKRHRVCCWGDICGDKAKLVAVCSSVRAAWLSKLRMTCKTGASIWARTWAVRSKAEASPVAGISIQRQRFSHKSAGCMRCAAASCWTSSYWGNKATAEVLRPAKMLSK